MGRIMGTAMRGGTIRAEYESKGIVHVTNDNGLKGALDANGAIAIALELKDNFKFLFNKDLGISTESMAIEIIGHVYPGVVADALKGVPGSSYISERTAVIDIGVSNYDGNRWVWDFFGERI